MIEDIQYLHENSEMDSAVIYIDSATRDRRFYPHPESYVINFSAPFKNVVGFDILDASIPTTMWNVDRYNGTLAITTVSVPTAGNKLMTEKYFKEVKNAQTFFRLFDRNHIVGLLNENSVLILDKNVYDELNITLTNTNSSYFIYTRHIITNTNIKLAPRNLSENSVYFFIHLDIKYYTDLDAPEVQYLEQKNFSLETDQYGNYNVIHYEEIEVTEAVYVSVKNTLNYLAEIKNMYKEIDLGNYDITTLKTELNGKWNNDDVFFDSTAQPDRKQGILIISSIDSFVVINSNIGRLIRQLGFDTLPTPDESNLYQLSPIGENRNIFASIYNLTDSKYAIRAPGIVNLLGDRYVILRCPEIEQHLLGSYAYVDSSPGLGLFKLAAGQNDITHLRFDFVNLVRKPFHPIGKLARLSIRFETQAGELYDFKGVNHQLLFVLKYLVPKQTHIFHKSILNPNYDADFVRYMSTSRTIQNKEDSDDEQDFTTKDNLAQYRKELQQYDYSSGEGSNTDDSEVEFDFSSGK
jgi:hypothetical protein